MRKKLRSLIYKGSEDMRERLFRLVLLVGLFVCVIAILVGIALKSPLSNALPISGLFIVLLFVAIVTFKYHKVEFASAVFGVVVTCIIFPLMFFASGGVDGGATVWFVLGLLYIFIMFRGKKFSVFLAMAVIMDIVTYTIAYHKPELVISLGSKSAIYFDSLFAVLTVGMAVGIIMRFQIRSYDKERKLTLKQKDAIEQISKSKDAFFANMSHEIRTPINTIIGLNDMILREDISDEVAEDAINVKNASKMLLTLINDVLDFSQIESDRMTISPIRYDTRELFDDVIGLLQVRMTEKNLDFYVDIDSELPSVLLGDEVRIKQVLINILTNAVKYTPKGSVTFAVRGELVEDGIERLTISVTDTGIGIKKEDLESLYDYFKRIDREKNRKIEGSGLGLAITKQLVSLMGGTITVDSIYTKGTVFTVIMDQQVVDARPIGKVEHLKRAKNSNLRHYKQSFEAPMAKILIVDDNETNLMVTKKLLRATKVQIDTAMSGTECLELIKKKVYHVILLDSMMPDMDGPATLKAIRRKERRMSRQTPVIVVTANAAAGDKQRYLDGGFDGYLSKPVDGKLLEEEIMKFLPESLIEYQADEEEYSRALKTAPSTLQRRRKKIQITTDCISDLSKEYMERNDIKAIFSYIETEKGMFRDTIEMDADNLLRHLSHEGSRALAVSASVEEYEAFYAEALTVAEDVVHIAMTAGAGNGYHTAVQAAEGFDHVHVIDSGHISCGEGLLVLTASKLLSNGCNQVDKLCHELDIVRQQIETSFLFPDSRSLYMSGHVSKRMSFFLDNLRLHPIIKTSENRLNLTGFQSGHMDKAKRRFIRRTLRKKRKIDTRIVFITHAGCSIKQQKEFVDEVLKCVPFKKVILEKASVSCSSNGGIGTMGLAYLTKINEKEYGSE